MMESKKKEVPVVSVELGKPVWSRAPMKGRGAEAKQ